MGRTALILGASGLVGSALLNQLLEDPQYSLLISLGRRPLSISNAKLNHQVVDFDHPKKWANWFAGVDVIFCAVGTTQKAVGGDDKLYRKVDYDIPVNAAKAAADQGVFSFILVSAVGADVDSQQFYLKLKGVTEESVSKQALSQVAILRPSLLLGERKEKRFGERMAQFLAPVVSPFLMGSASKYKPVSADQVAATMRAIADKPERGIRIYHFDDFKALTKK